MYDEPRTEDERRNREAARERKEWAELYHIYERCVGIAEKIWKDKLDTAAAQQQALSENMRDREPLWAKAADWPGAPTMMMDRSIPVPLFTPRDRLQFVKEASATLLISADRRNLTALYKDPDGETELAQAKEAVAGEGPVEAASGADETVYTEAFTNGSRHDAPAPLADASQYGERVPEAPAPRV